MAETTKTQWLRLKAACAVDGLAKLTDDGFKTNVSPSAMEDFATLRKLVLANVPELKDYMPPELHVRSHYIDLYESCMQIMNFPDALEG